MSLSRSLGCFLLMLQAAVPAFAQLPALIPFHGKDGRWGYADSTRKLVIPCRYEEAGIFQGDTAIVYWDKYRGTLDRKGRLLRIDSSGSRNQPVPVSFPFVWQLQPYTLLLTFAPAENPALRPVSSLSGAWGYCNKRGDTVIACRYQSAGYFSEGLAFVSMGDSLSGFIDTKGRLQFRFPPADVRSADQFRYGRCVVSGDMGGGVIDDRGRWVIPPVNSPPPRLIAENCILSGPDGWQYFTDRNGRPVENRFYSGCGNLAEGCLLVSDAHTGFFGFANAKGRLVIPCQYSQAGNFTDGAAPVCLASGEGWKLIDAAGRDLLPARYLSIEGRGYGIYALEGEDGYRLYDAAAKGFLPGPAWQEAGYFDSPGWASVMDSSGRYGMIDRKGKIVIPFRYEAALSFYGTAADARAVVVADSRYGMIDRSGREVIAPQYSDLRPFNRFGLAWAQDWQGMWGCIDSLNNTHIKFIYSDLSDFDESGLAEVREGGERYYIDWKGTVYREE